MTIDKYLDKLAAKTPVPGGGSAAALIGAVGMALLSMTAMYTSKRAGSRSNIPEIVKFAGRSRRRLLKLMRRDEEAYLKLSKAMKGRGEEGITRLYRNATLVPLEISTILEEGIKRCGRLSPHCRRCLATDIVEAVLFLEAGFLSAKLNAEINLGGIKDEACARKVRLSLSRRKNSIKNIKKRILKKWQQLS